MFIKIFAPLFCIHVLCFDSMSKFSPPTPPPLTANPAPTPQPIPQPPPSSSYFSSTISKFFLATLVKTVFLWYIKRSLNLSYIEWLSGGWINENYR